jgi:ribosomal protein L12E/L44/L45/RPP1/RPP2
MTITEQHSAFLVALESNNIQEAIRIANIVDWVAIAPAIISKPIDTIAADNATKNNSKVEGAILRRQEKLTFAF